VRTIRFVRIVALSSVARRIPGQHDRAAQESHPDEESKIPECWIWGNLRRI